MKTQQTPPVDRLDPPELVMNSFRFSVLFVVVFICIRVCLIAFIMFNQLFLLFLFHAYVHLTFMQTLRLQALIQ